jgi:hypothetical protein
MRATAVIGLAPDLKPEQWDHSELEKYGLGKGTLFPLSHSALFLIAAFLFVFFLLLYYSEKFRFIL